MKKIIIALFVCSTAFASEDSFPQITPQPIPRDRGRLDLKRYFEKHIRREETKLAQEKAKLQKDVAQERAIEKGMLKIILQQNHYQNY